MVFHTDFENYNENIDLYDKNMVYKQNTFLYQKIRFRDISPSSRYVVEGLFLHILIKFRTLYNQFKPIL